jgi:hypothetical protein
MGKVLIALIVLVVGAVVFVWLRTPKAPPIPVAMSEDTVPSTSAAPPTPAYDTMANTAVPKPAQPAGKPASNGGKPLDLQINSEADLLAAMSSLGIEDLDDRMTRWALSRGYPEFDQAGNYLLDQPYQQYDEATLRGLADGGDMWAQQILAQQIATDRPKEALDYYKRAAENGSVYAMQEIARLYYRESNQLRAAEPGSTRDAGAEASGPDVTAYAWLAAAEGSGWDPTRGASLIPLIGRKLSQEQVTEACKMSDTLRTQMGAARGARGLQGFDRTPPPIVYDAQEMGAATQCHPDQTSAYDLSGCREADVHTGNTSTRVWVCSPQG